MYIKICVYVYMCIYMYMCIYEYIYVCIYIYIYIYAHICIYMRGGSCCQDQRPGNCLLLPACHSFVSSRSSSSSNSAKSANSSDSANGPNSRQWLQYHSDNGSNSFSSNTYLPAGKRGTLLEALVGGWEIWLAALVSRCGTLGGTEVSGFVSYQYRGTPLTRKRTPLGTYCRPLPRFLGGSNASRPACTCPPHGRGRSFAAIRKDTGLYCGSRLRKGEVFAYVGLSHNLKDLKGSKYTQDTRRAAAIPGDIIASCVPFKT